MRKPDFCICKNKRCRSAGQTGFLVTQLICGTLVDQNKRCHRNTSISNSMFAPTYEQCREKKNVFGVSDQVRYKPECGTTEEISELGSKEIVLSVK